MSAPNCWRRTRPSGGWAATCVRLRRLRPDVATTTACGCRTTTASRSSPARRGGRASQHAGHARALGAASQALEEDSRLAALPAARCEPRRRPARHRRRRSGNLAAIGSTRRSIQSPTGSTCPSRHRHRAAASDRPMTAVFLGRIYPVKGLPMLVEAWARVRPAGWRLIIAGPDEAGHRSEVEAGVAAAGLTGSIASPAPSPAKPKRRCWRTPTFSCCRATPRALAWPSPRRWRTARRC